jgi:hypothetical protein
MPGRSTSGSTTFERVGQNSGLFFHCVPDSSGHAPSRISQLEPFDLTIVVHFGHRVCIPQIWHVSRPFSSLASGINAPTSQKGERVLMSPLGPNCVKTPRTNFRVERLSRLRRKRKEPLWHVPSKEEKRENNSAHSPRVHVFTQPGSKRKCRPVGLMSALPR